MSTNWTTEKVREAIECVNGEFEATSTPETVIKYAIHYLDVNEYPTKLMDPRDPEFEYDTEPRTTYGEVMFIVDIVNVTLTLAMDKVAENLQPRGVILTEGLDHFTFNE